MAPLSIGPLIFQCQWSKSGWYIDQQMSSGNTYKHYLLCSMAVVKNDTGLKCLVIVLGWLQITMFWMWQQGGMVYMTVEENDQK